MVTKVHRQRRKVERTERREIRRRSRLAAGRSTNSKRNSGLGLVLAYIGWQVSDRTMVEQGLAEMADSPQAGLEELLRVIWLAPVSE